MFGNLFTNLKQDENKEQKNLFNGLNIEEDIRSYKNYKNTKDNKLHPLCFTHLGVDIVKEKCLS